MLEAVIVLFCCCFGYFRLLEFSLVFNCLVAGKETEKRKTMVSVSTVFDVRFFLTSQFRLSTIFKVIAGQAYDCCKNTKIFVLTF